MNRMDEFDALRGEDWSKVYRDVPQSVNEGVQLAFARIHARERRRRQTLRFASMAACLCLLAGAGALVLGRGGNSTDHVASPSVAAQLLSRDSIVYASLDDACFHVHENCGEILDGAVQLQLVTALEFEKRACPACAANILLPEENG